MVAYPQQYSQSASQILVATAAGNASKALEVLNSSSLEDIDVYGPSGRTSEMEILYWLAGRPEPNDSSALRSGSSAAQVRYQAEMRQGCLGNFWGKSDTGHSHLSKFIYKHLQGPVDSQFDVDMERLFFAFVKKREDAQEQEKTEPRSREQSFAQVIPDTKS